MTPKDALDEVGFAARCWCGDQAEEALAVLTALVEQREGWKLVPLKPTEEMIDCALRLQPDRPRVCMEVAIEDAIEAAPDAPQQPVVVTVEQREGWKLVPLKPTEYMLTEAWKVETAPISEGQVRRMYAAMIGAAPDAPQQPAFRNMKDGATFEEYRDALAVGNLTVVDQLAFDNMLHDLLQQPVVVTDALAQLAEKWHRRSVEEGQSGDEWEATIYRECADELTAALQQGKE